MTLNNVGYARIAVVVDPDNFINESLKSNGQTISVPFIVRLPGIAMTVPTNPSGRYAPLGWRASPRRPRPQPKVQAALNRAARVAARQAAQPAKKLKRHPAPKTNSVVDKAISLGTELTKLPHQAISAISKSL